MSETHAPTPEVGLARRILFLCVHNSSRSQIAEAFARAKAPSGSEIWSAGTRPTEIHPLAIQVMREIDLDLSHQRSKGLDEVPWREADTVVTLCAEGDDECPVLPVTVKRIHWPLTDPTTAPEDRRLEVFRKVRDEIRWRVASLWPRGD